MKLHLRRCFVYAVAFVLLVSSGSAVPARTTSNSTYEIFKAIGKHAGEEAVAMIKKQTGRVPTRNKFIVLSNAGYAEIAGQSTMGALDGVSEITRVSRGENTLLEIHSASESSLWFAVYDRGSGNCAYLQVDPSAVGGHSKTLGLFSIRSIARIDAEHLFSSDPKSFDLGFGGNEFRIVTIANGIAAGVPAGVARSFEFHDHYCPGVTSGIMLANYVKRYFAGSGVKAYFVHGVQPWCKEDALMVMLNATPGKNSYAVTYSTDEDRSHWPEAPVDCRNVCNIIYGRKADGSWEGLILGFQFASSEETGCGKYSHSAVGKLCADLWYLGKLDSPDRFVKLCGTFKLDASDHPKNYARPGVNVMSKLP